MYQKINLVLLILISLILVYIIFKPEKQANLPNYSERIDSLESRLSNIKIKRDSIKKRIDTTIIKINYNEKLTLYFVGNGKSSLWFPLPLRMCTT